MYKYSLVFLFLLFLPAVGSAELGYNRGKAKGYAQHWCGDNNIDPKTNKLIGYNPDYISYGNPDPKNPGNHTGTDCANFVSQVLWAGGLDLNIHPPACLLAYQVISSTPGRSGWVGAQALINGIQTYFCVKNMKILLTYISYNNTNMQRG
ncbi:MAG: amidase domain-containing protein [Deltaproteobacteria bacterium]|nr:amidase domain-containing protein [Deltaproteobacteria bacterium]